MEFAFIGRVSLCLWPIPPPPTSFWVSAQLRRWATPPHSKNCPVQSWPAQLPWPGSHKHRRDSLRGISGLVMLVGPTQFTTWVRPSRCTALSAHPIADQTPPDCAHWTAPTLPQKSPGCRLRSECRAHDHWVLKRDSDSDKWLTSYQIEECRLF